MTQLELFGDRGERRKVEELIARHNMNIVYIPPTQEINYDNSKGDQHDQ